MARPLKQIQEGTKFGRLTFIKDAFIDDTGRRYSEYDCDCGEKGVIMRTSPILCGKVSSCGCKRGGTKYFELIPEEEKEQIRELSKTISIKQLGLRFNHDRVTIHKILGIEKQKEQPQEGFFDYDAYVKSDFILQS